MLSSGGKHRCSLLQRSPRLKAERLSVCPDRMIIPPANTKTQWIAAKIKFQGLASHCEVGPLKM